METVNASSDGNSAAASSPGPTTFTEAFASDASSATDPTQTPSTPPAAAQPGTSAVDASQQGADDRSPFIPRQRFDEVNTALKEAKAWREQYGWAERVNPQDLQQATALARTLSANPVQGLQQLIAEIQKNPQHAAEIRSLAARALAQRSPAAPEPPSMVKVQLEDGSVVDLPRDPAAWLAHQKQTWMAELDQKIQPLQRTHETLQAERAALAHTQQVDRFVTTTFADVQTWPGMDKPEARAAVAKALAAASIDANDPREVAIALRDAWRTAVVPGLTSSAEATLLDSLKTKATASKTVNPSSSAAASPRAVTSFFDKSLTWK